MPWPGSDPRAGRVKHPARSGMALTRPTDNSSLAHLFSWVMWVILMSTARIAAAGPRTDSLEDTMTTTPAGPLSPAQRDLFATAARTNLTVTDLGLVCEDCAPILDGGRLTPDTPRPVIYGYRRIAENSHPAGSWLRVFPGAEATPTHCTCCSRLCVTDQHLYRLTPHL